MVAKKKDWVPARQDVIWIDCNPQAGREMRDLHPFLVLSPQNFNAKTSLVIGLPMTTAEYNADNPFAVAAGKAKGKTGKTSYVLCHQPKSFDWRMRHAKPHPLRKLDEEHFAQACAVLEQIIQLTASSVVTKDEKYPVATTLVPLMQLAADRALLVDCGLFQGQDATPSTPPVGASPARERAAGAGEVGAASGAGN